MKKILFVLLLVLSISLTACVSSVFEGSRMGNESQLIMEYKVLNKTESQKLKLAEGDIVYFEVVNQSGSISISLKKEGDEPVFEGKNISTSTFQVGVEESGIYTVSVTGRNAKGSISITKEEE